MTYVIKPKREAVVRPSCKEGKSHRWICADAVKGVVKARCKVCRQRTEFRTEPEVYDFSNRTPISLADSRHPKDRIYLETEFMDGFAQ